MNWLSSLVLAVVLLFSAITIAGAEVRTLKIYHLHTGEKAEIAFKKDGRYLPGGLKKLNYILRDWRRNESIRMDPRLFDLIWAVYQKAGSNEYINVVCGYRAPETNSMLRRRSRGVAENSQHMVGRALDFFIPGVPLRKLREVGLQMEVGGVGYYPTSGSPFVHMDVGSPRYWPRMSRRELLALFPQGKTLYVPSDGRPLAGYEKALAEYKVRKGKAPDVEIASASGQHKGLLASLFGGGADEADDNSDIQMASARGGPAKPGISKMTTASLPRSGNDTAVPAGKTTDQPETIVAALPHTAPLPERAPRPEVAVATDPAVDETSSAQLALNIPLSLSRPDHTSQPTKPFAIPDVGLNVAATDASHAPSDSETDQIAALFSRKESLSADAQRGAIALSGASVTLASFTTALPSSLPDLNTGSIARLTQPMASPDHEQRTQAIIQSAVYTTGSAGKGDRLVATKVSVPPQLALLEQQDGASKAAAAIATGVSTTDKEARTMPGEGKQQPKSFAVPLPQSLIRWALQTGSFNEEIEGQKVHSIAYAMVHAAPRTVYMAGFQPGDPGEDASRFTGSAVTFLSVAKFDGPE